MQTLLTLILLAVTRAAIRRLDDPAGPENRAGVPVLAGTLSDDLRPGTSQLWAAVHHSRGDYQTATDAERAPLHNGRTRRFTPTTIRSAQLRPVTPPLHGPSITPPVPRSRKRAPN